MPSNPREKLLRKSDKKKTEEAKPRETIATADEGKQVTEGKQVAKNPDKKFHFNPTKFFGEKPKPHAPIESNAADSEKDSVLAGSTDSTRKLKKDDKLRSSSADRDSVEQPASTSDPKRENKPEKHRFSFHPSKLFSDKSKQSIGEEGKNSENSEERRKKHHRHDSRSPVSKQETDGEEPQPLKETPDGEKKTKSKSKSPRYGHHMAPNDSDRHSPSEEETKTKGHHKSHRNEK